MAEHIADIVSRYALLYTGVFFFLVLISMIFTPNRDPKPPLDWAFIAEKASLTFIALWGYLVLEGVVPRDPWVRIVMWSALGVSETMVLWFIYQERFGRGWISARLRRMIHCEECL